MVRGVFREMGDERARYGRRSISDRLGELVDWMRAHRVATAAIVLFLALGFLRVALPSRPALPANLVVGDCLFIRTSAAMQVGASARPIGEPREVASVLHAGAAEFADCRASHGHEVSLVIDLASLSPAEAQPASLAGRCEAAFGPYVGRGAEGSTYETFAALPTADQSAAGARHGVCLVARRDGQWMSAPARDSGA